MQIMDVKEIRADLEVTPHEEVMEKYKKWL
jgi:hypothetical protein